MSVNNDDVHFVSKKKYSKIKIKITSSVTLVISVRFSQRGQVFFVAFEQRQNVIVRVM